ncbi:MAG: FeoC-like transcriptional regulator [Gammaproteobacteria bacterium]
MLRKLLSTVAAGRVGNTAELAVAIDASPAMVDVMVGELERRGMLQRAGDCGAVCTGCPTEPVCGSKAAGSAWMLTAAGRRYTES